MALHALATHRPTGAGVMRPRQIDFVLTSFPAAAAKCRPDVQTASDHSPIFLEIEERTAVVAQFRPPPPSLRLWSVPEDEHEAFNDALPTALADTYGTAADHQHALASTTASRRSPTDLVAEQYAPLAPCERDLLRLQAAVRAGGW